jgi:hypothetical protein
MMMEGREFIRYTRQSPPARVLLYLQAGLGETRSAAAPADRLSAPFPSPRPQTYSLVWVDPATPKETVQPTHTSFSSAAPTAERNSVPLEEISELALGRQSSILAQQAEASKEDRCFSIQVAGGSHGGASDRDGSALVLELEATSENLRVSWVYGLTALLKTTGVPYKLRPGRKSTATSSTRAKSPSRFRSQDGLLSPSGSLSSPSSSSPSGATDPAVPLTTRTLTFHPSSFTSPIKMRDEESKEDYTNEANAGGSRFQFPSNSVLDSAMSLSDFTTPSKTSLQQPHPDIVYELTVKCRFLTRLRGKEGPNANPIVCVFLNETVTAGTPTSAVKFRYLEQTELVRGNNNPLFRKKFHLSPNSLQLSLNALQSTILKFSVYVSHISSRFCFRRSSSPLTFDSLFLFCPRMSPPT